MTFITLEMLSEIEKYRVSRPRCGSAAVERTEDELHAFHLKRAKARSGLQARLVICVANWLDSGAAKWLATCVAMPDHASIGHGASL